MNINTIRKISLPIILFAILALAPISFVFADCPSNTTVSGTTVNFVGELTDMGGETATVWFEYGPATSYGYNAPSRTLNSAGMYCIQVSNLNSCTTYYYRAAAQNSAGTSYGDRRTFTTSCQNSQNPNVDLKVNGSDGPVYVQPNNAINLSWTSSNADSCHASNGWTGARGTSGSWSVGSIVAGTYTYTLTCTGPGGSSSDSVNATVQTQTSSFTVTKNVRNLTKGTGFLSSAYANPSDVLMFMITLHNPGGTLGNQDVQNVVVKDTLPANLIYSNQLVVARSNNVSSNYSGDIVSGVNLYAIPAGQTVTITYQAQVAAAQNFSYGTTTLTNNVYVTSSNSSYNPSANASVFVTRSSVLGASTISTGLTNNFWVDSFILPLLITITCIWMWRSGLFFGIEKWLDNKRKIRRGYKSEKELTKRIKQIARN